MVAVEAAVPVGLQGGAEQVLGLGDGGSGAQAQLGLVVVLVRRLPLQGSVDGDGYLLHGRGLQRRGEGKNSGQDVDGGVPRPTSIPFTGITIRTFPVPCMLLPLWRGTWESPGW